MDYGTAEGVVDDVVFGRDRATERRRAAERACSSAKVIDLKRGNVVHSLRIEGIVVEL